MRKLEIKLVKINNSFDAIIIGADFAGIGMAIKLKQKWLHPWTELFLNQKKGCSLLLI